MDTQVKPEGLTGTVSAYLPDRGWGYIQRITNEGQRNEEVIRHWFHASSFKGKEEGEAMVGMNVSFTLCAVRGGKHWAVENVKELQTNWIFALRPYKSQAQI